MFGARVTFTTRAHLANLSPPGARVKEGTGWTVNPSPPPPRIAVPRDPRGRWARWYESVIEDKVTYSDREFRAFASVVALGSSRGGEFKDRAALEHLLGPLADQIDVLIERKDLRRTGGKRLTVAGWPTYQGGRVDNTAAARQQALRDRRRAALEAGQGAEEPSTSPPGALVEVSSSPPIHDQSLRRDVTPRARPPISSPLGSTSTPSNGNAGARNGFDVETWATIVETVDDLTGGGINGLSNPHSTLGQRALELAASFGLAPTIATIRSVAEGLDHPDARQLVTGANSALRPFVATGRAKPVSEAEREQQRVHERVMEAVRAGGHPQEGSRR